MTGTIVEAFIVDAGVAAVAGVRRTVLRICREAGLPVDVGNTAVLLVSELTTNAVRYAPPPFRVSVTAGDRGLRVEVTDDSDQLPVTRADDPGSLGGRGLTIIDRLATAWGVHSRVGGKTVWFELSEAARPAPFPAPEPTASGPEQQSGPER